MIVGIGMDLTELDRIARTLDRHGRHFLCRVLSEEEMELLPSGRTRIPYVAARFAAKEAALKALGTGMSRGIGLKDVVVGRLPSGQPSLVFVGTAAGQARKLGVRVAHISLTHSRTTAGAVVILEG